MSTTGRPEHSAPLSLAVLFLSPHDGISTAVMDALRNIGCAARALTLDDPWPAAGVLLISKPFTDTQPFAPGECFVGADLKHMAATVCCYPSRPKQRARLTAGAYDVVVRRHTMEHMAARLIESLP